MGMGRDDECRIRKHNAPANFSTVKHMASNLLRRAPGKDSLRLKRKMAAWDDDFLASFVVRNYPFSLPRSCPTNGQHSTQINTISLQLSRHSQSCLTAG